MEKAKKVTRIFLASVLGACLVYDIVIVVLKLWGATLSKETTFISVRFIGIPVMWGVLAAHFFMGRIGRKLFGKISKLRYAIWIPIAVFIVTISIVGCFREIPALIWLGQRLYIPLFFGQVLGLLWW